MAQLNEEAARIKDRAGAGGERERELERLRTEVRHERWDGALGLVGKLGAGDICRLLAKHDAH